MKNNNVKISSLQLGIFIIVTVVGVGILTLPREVVEIAGPDGWILIITGGIFALATAMIMNTLGQRFPQQTIIEYSRELIGAPLTILLSIIFASYCIVFSAFVVRIFGEVLKMFLLARTPIEVIIISFLLTSVYLIRSGLEGIARFYEVMVVLMFVPFFITLFSGAHEGDYTNMLPAFQTPPATLLKGTFQIFFSFIGFETILFFIPLVSDQKNIKKTLWITIISLTLIYLVTSVVVIASFGIPESKELVWPLMSFVKAIEVPGAFIEQLEGIIMAIWVLFAFTTLSAFYFTGTFILSKVTKTMDHKGFVILLIPIIYILSLQPDNVAEIYDWVGIFSTYAGTLVVLIIPILLLVIAVIRKKGGKVNG